MRLPRKTFRKIIDPITGKHRCAKCEIFKDPSEFGDSKRTTSGKKGYCKPCDSAIATAYYHRNIDWIKAKNAEKRKTSWAEVQCDYVKKYQRTLLGRFTTLRKRARYRGLSCTLTLEDYAVLTASLTCIYCGDPLPAMGAGLDRKNSKLGYEKDNCAPCCGPCNTLRGHDRISYGEMLEVVALLKRMRGVTPTFWDGQVGVAPLPFLRAVVPISPSADCT